MIRVEKKERRGGERRGGERKREKIKIPGEVRSGEGKVRGGDEKEEYSSKDHYSFHA